MGDNSDGKYLEAHDNAAFEGDSPPMSRRRTISFGPNSEYSKDDTNSTTAQKSALSRKISQYTMPDDVSSVISELDFQGTATKHRIQEKGWTLGSLLCIAYCFMLIMIAIALQISFIFATDTIDHFFIQEFEIFLFSVALLGIATLLVLGALQKLTTNNHYRDRRRASFIRAGMLVLGSGSVIYRLLYLMAANATPSSCYTHIDITLTVIGLFSVVAEISLLFVFTKVRINKMFSVAMFARLIVMHCIASNVCLWLRVVVEESLHEIHLANGDHGDHNNTTGNDTDHHLFIGDAVDLDASLYASDEIPEECQSFSTLINSLIPYLYPLIIEFSVLVTSMWISVWENCGVSIVYNKPEVKDNKEPQTRRRSVSKVTDQGEILRDIGCTMEKQSGYKNTNIGFLMGWLVLLLSLVVTIIFLFWVLSDHEHYTEPNIIGTSYGSSMILSIMLMISVPVTVYGMRTLPSHRKLQQNHDEDHAHTDELRQHLGHSLDKRLLFITSMSLVIFKLLCIIAAISEGNVIIATDGVISAIASLMQTMFINSYALDKVCVTNYQRRVKPGRQGLEFIRCTNLALWIISTFLLKNTAAKSIQYEVFGTTAFAVLANVFQPLAILHYFHAMICVAEVVAGVYSDKHVYIMETVEDYQDPFDDFDDHPHGHHHHQWAISRENADDLDHHDHDHHHKHHHHNNHHENCSHDHSHNNPQGHHHEGHHMGKRHHHNKHHEQNNPPPTLVVTESSLDNGQPEGPDVHFEEPSHEEAQMKF